MRKCSSFFFARFEIDRLLNLGPSDHIGCLPVREETRRFLLRCIASFLLGNAIHGGGVVHVVMIVVFLAIPGLLLVAPILFVRNISSQNILPQASKIKKIATLSPPIITTVSSVLAICKSYHIKETICILEQI